MTTKKFDQALERFRQACLRAAQWNAYPGVAYRTRLEGAMEEVLQAYEDACWVDDKEAAKASLDMDPEEYEEDFFDEALGG